MEISDEIVERFYRALRDDDRHPDSYAALRSALGVVAEDLAELGAAKKRRRKFNRADETPQYLHGYADGPDQHGEWSHPDGAS